MMQAGKDFSPSVMFIVASVVNKPVPRSIEAKKNLFANYNAVVLSLVAGDMLPENLIE